MAISIDADFYRDPALLALPIEARWGYLAVLGIGWSAGWADDDAFRESVPGYVAEWLDRYLSEGLLERTATGGLAIPEVRRHASPGAVRTARWRDRASRRDVTEASHGDVTTPSRGDVTAPLRLPPSLSRETTSSERESGGGPGEPTSPGDDDAGETAVLAWFATNVGYVPETSGYARSLFAVIDEVGHVEVIRRLDRLRESGQVGRRDVAGYVFAVRDAFRRPVVLAETREARSDRLVRLAEAGYRHPDGLPLARLTDAQLDDLEAGRVR